MAPTTAAPTPDRPPVTCIGPMRMNSASCLAPSDSPATSANRKKFLPNLVRIRFARGAGSLSIRFCIDVLAWRRPARDGVRYTVREPAEAVTKTPQEAMRSGAATTKRSRDRVVPAEHCSMQSLPKPAPAMGELGVTDEDLGFGWRRLSW